MSLNLSFSSSDVDSWFASRNLIAIALVDAAWLALVLVAITPLRI